MPEETTPQPNRNVPMVIDILPKPKKNNGSKKEAEYYIFVKWCAMPAAIREPKTQKELAVKIDVEEGTLSDWKRREGFHDLVSRETDNWLRDKLPDVYGAFYNATLRDPSVERLEYYRSLAGKAQIQTRNPSEHPPVVVPVQVNIDREKYSK